MPVAGIGAVRRTEAVHIGAARHIEVVRHTVVVPLRNILVPP
jgi:hypothetical protein